MILSPVFIVVAVFLVTYFFIATEKVDKTIAALLGAATVIFLHAAPFETLLEKIDLNVLGLLMGMMMIVNILATTGVFEWIAVKIARMAKGNALVIFISFMTVTALLSAFLDNVTTVILIAPITILIAQILEISAIPFLIMEAVFSNIGGTATLVGDPPNIIIGSRFGVSFNAFIFNLGPPILVLMAVALCIIYFVAKKKNLKSAAHAVELIHRTNPSKAIIEPARLKSALIIFALVLIGFFTSRFAHVEPGIIALSGGVVMTMVCKVDIHHVLEKVEWATILFFAGLFMLIGALELNGVFEDLGEAILSLTQGHLLLTVIVILWFSAFSSAIVDNIPLVIAMIPLIKSIVPVFAKQMGLEGAEAINTQIEAPLLWALALGACLGGNGTLIGASANVVVVQIARRNKYKISFWEFTKYGLPMMVLSLLLASAYIYLRYFHFR